MFAMEKNYIKIGQMSRMFGISKQTLHYYDKIGIFSPKVVGENGYRLYKYEQCLQLASILYLKKMGFTLSHIQEIKNDLNLTSYRESLVDQYQILEDEVSRIQETQRAMKRKLSFIESQSDAEKYDKIAVHHTADRYYYNIGDEYHLYDDQGFYHNPTVVFYKGDQRRFGCYLYSIAKYPVEKSIGHRVEKIDGGKFLCGYHKGAYQNILDRVNDMRAFGKNLSLDTESIHFNIIDQFVERDEEDFLTLINIRIVE